MIGHSTASASSSPGGSRGIGAAVAAKLAECGAGVVVNGRDADAVGATVDAITGAGGRAVPHAGSAADEAVADELIALCESHFGAIDALVNCAGTAEPPGSSILTVSAEQFRGPHRRSPRHRLRHRRAAAPKMVARGRGAIVNTSSFAFLGDYGGTGYPAGKGAVNGLTLAIAAELAEHGCGPTSCARVRTRLSTGPEYEEQIHTLQRRGHARRDQRSGRLDPRHRVRRTDVRLPVSDLAAKVTGQIFIAAGNFVGRFDRPRTESARLPRPSRLVTVVGRRIAAMLA